jgi:hypothetical protein
MLTAHCLTTNINNKYIAMGHRKQPERRTYLEDRLEILIKRQESGTASFNELTELDAIVNSYPEIRKRIIMENLLMGDTGDFNEPVNDPQKENMPQLQTTPRISFISRLKGIISRIFRSQMSGANLKLLANRFAFI